MCCILTSSTRITYFLSCLQRITSLSGILSDLEASLESGCALKENFTLRGVPCTVGCLCVLRCLSAVVLLQGLPALGVDREGMRGILVEVAELAASSSIVMGELPEMTRSQGEDMLAEAGMLGMLSGRAPVSDVDPHSDR